MMLQSNGIFCTFPPLILGDVAVSFHQKDHLSVCSNLLCAFVQVQAVLCEPRGDVEEVFLEPRLNNLVFSV